MSSQRTEDLTVTQGTDALFKISIKDSAGAAFDVSAKAFSAAMKKSFSSPDNTKIEIQTNIANDELGIISLALSNEVTATLDTSSRYVYDVMMYDRGTNTEIITILSGKVFVKASVTRVS